jgi:tripartite-type tricarboxylate transporter receptor subunit TctC
VSSGKLRALGVSGIKRLAVLPEVPTIAEAGYKGFEVNNWYGVLAPGETPRAVVTRLNADINALINSADVRERMAALGAEPAGGTAEQFAQRLRDEIALWHKVFAKMPPGKAR